MFTCDGFDIWEQNRGIKRHRSANGKTPQKKKQNGRGNARCICRSFFSNGVYLFWVNFSSSLLTLSSLLPHHPCPFPSGLHGQWEVPLRERLRRFPQEARRQRQRLHRLREDHLRVWRPAEKLQRGSRQVSEDHRGFVCRPELTRWFTERCAEENKQQKKQKHTPSVYTLVPRLTHMLKQSLRSSQQFALIAVWTTRDTYRPIRWSVYPLTPGILLDSWK